MTDFEFELDKVFSEIRKRKPALVALQFPEGLKTRSKKIASEIESATGCTTFSFIDPIFGACMLADDKAKALGADLLVHFGHSRFYQESLPTLYVPVYYRISDSQIKKTAKKIADELTKKNNEIKNKNQQSEVKLKNRKNEVNQTQIKKIGLVGTIQYLRVLPKLKKELESIGFFGCVGKGTNVSDGQVLGCNYSSPKSIIENVDATVYVGDGRFHPIGIVLATKKPVFTIEPFELKFREIGNEKDRFVRQRITLIGSLQNSRHFGILVSTEKGQWGIKKALLAKKTIEKHGKHAVILVGDLVKPEYVLGIQPLDCLVNTACPRIATDDFANYSAPVI